MNEITLESFITYCDDMMISNESLKPDKLLEYYGGNTPDNRNDVMYDLKKMTKNEALRRLKLLIKNLSTNTPQYNEILSLMAASQITKDEFNKLIKDVPLTHDEEYCYQYLSNTNDELESSRSHMLGCHNAYGFRLIALDGSGNGLIYSIKYGRFYDYDHERDGIRSFSKPPTWMDDGGVTFEELIFTWK